MTEIPSPPSTNCLRSSSVSVIMASALPGSLVSNPTTGSYAGDREHAERAATSVDELEWRSDHNRTSWWQLIEVAQAGQPELPRTMHDRVVRERRIEAPRLPRIRSDGFDADTEDVALVREELRRLLVKRSEERR